MTGRQGGRFWARRVRFTVHPSHRRQLLGIRPDRLVVQARPIDAQEFALPSHRWPVRRVYFVQSTAIRDPHRGLGECDGADGNTVGLDRSDCRKRVALNSASLPSSPLLVIVDRASCLAVDDRAGELVRVVGSFHLERDAVSLNPDLDVDANVRQFRQVVAKKGHPGHGGIVVLQEFVCVKPTFLAVLSLPRAAPNFRDVNGLRITRCTTGAEEE